MKKLWEIQAQGKNMSHMTKPKPNLTPEQQVEQGTWTIRKPSDPEIRKMVRDVMIAKGLTRSEAVLYLVKQALPGVMKRALEEEQASLTKRKQELDALAKEYGLSSGHSPKLKPNNV